ncbi:hypothetical protein RB653_006538 [Dictyostelium firmibasis]|uniref:HIT-type domain-containing protein n=1 Tax=Dictyostelium firmibasis TaxID=79012 RepID=A0AAN7UC59_9MYCE
MDNSTTHNKTKPLCSICNIKEFIYTCPKCKNIKYCSLVCFSKHKELVNNHEINVEINVNKENKIEEKNIDRSENEKEDIEIEESSSQSEDENDEEFEPLENEEDSEGEFEEDSEGENVKAIRKEPIDNSKVSKFSESLSYYKKVNDEQFQKLDNSKYINNVITVKRLQQLILEIDQQPSDQDRIELLQKYRKKLPEFNDFILKVLATIDNLDSLTIDEDGNLIKK